MGWNLNVGDRVEIDVVSDQVDDPEQDAFKGPGVVDQIYPRGCFVQIDTGVPGYWWIPKRHWDTAILSVKS